MHVVVIGRQGSGKGTQCARLAEHLGVPHISTGDLFRVAVRRRTDLGLRIQRYLRDGELVPEGLALAVLADRLAEDDTTERGFVLDGFPRTVGQARRLTELIGPANLDVVFELAVPEAVVVRRMLERRVCVDCANVESVADLDDVATGCSRCGGALKTREDDAEPVIRRRLELFEARTAPLMRWFESAGLLTRIDGVGPPDLIARRFLDALPSAGTADDRGAPADRGVAPGARPALASGSAVNAALLPVVPPMWASF
jgi:adenylate kinase